MAPVFRPLRGVIIAQFLVVFNSGAWKYLVVLLALRAARDTIGTEGALYDAYSYEQTTIAFCIFTIPFIIISLPAGVLADRVSKRTILVATKAFEVVLLAAGTASLAAQPAGDATLLVVLALFGFQAAFFSPAKYGILPEILPHDKLSEGNGRLEMWTFFAVIGGIVAGGAILQGVGEQVWLAGLVLTLLAAAGLVAAWLVPPVPAARSEGGLAATATGAWAALRADRVLRLSVLGNAFYWTVASLLGQIIYVYSNSPLGLGLPEHESGVPLAIFGIGVGLGSVLAGRLSASKVEYGLIPLGAAALAFCTLLLAAFGPGFTGTILLMVPLGVGSGFLVVPLNALIQWRAPADRRGGVIALTNTLVFGGILVGSLVAYALSRAELSPRGIFLGAALIVIAGTAWALWLLPDAFLRLLLVLLTHTLYRLKVVGREHVPAEGGALLTPNHVTFVDGLFLLGSLDRPIRFLVEPAYFYKPLYRPFLQALGAIPISASEGPRVLLRALREAGQYLDAGELVCIFPEGQLTRTGTLQAFQRGMEKIVEGRTTPIIPVHIDRVWGSIFSRAGGRFLTKLPQRIPYPVTVTFGPPLPADTPVPEVRRVVQELGAAAWEHRKPDRRPLHHGFVRRARRHPFRLAFADGQRGALGGFPALVRAVALARALRPAWQDQPHVGILLPPSVAGALVNIAAALAGRTSVNLNYTAGKAGMTSAARQAELRTVVTSRAFVEKANLELPEGVTPIWLEDVSAGLSRGDRVRAFLLALLAPVRLLERACGATQPPQVDDVVTIIFSSGSTGDPKGVLLSHLNIDANIDGLAQIIVLEPDDRMMGILPLFHSFGYLTLWFSANLDLGMIYHPSPLDAAAIGGLVERYRATLLLATPTFLQLYLRRCTPAQFGSLRIVLAGAEKLSERLAQAFEETFGVRPLEGYGATECAPVIAASTLDFRGPGFYQPGSRRGSVGQPLPNVAIRIVDPDTFAPLPPDTPGLLLVKGPNVMRGYLKRDDLTAKAMRDGWYITGDIATQDENGFLRITDRLSRFSKIGGEMVPHGRVEEALQEAAGREEQVFAVTAVPDEKKGERLAVLHTLDEKEIPAILDKVAASGLPNLFLPRPDAFVKVDKLPVLGTGKIDLRAVKRLAVETRGGP